MASRRTRTEIFHGIVEKIRLRKLIGKGELSKEIFTDQRLFDQIINAMEKVGMIRFVYTFDPNGKQRRVIEALNIDDTGLYIKALSEIIAPSLAELLEEYYGRRAPEPRMTSEELAKEKDNKRFFNLVKRSFSSQRATEEV